MLDAGQCRCCCDNGCRSCERCWMLDAGCWASVAVITAVVVVSDARYWMLDAGQCRCCCDNGWDFMAYENESGDRSPHSRGGLPHRASLTRGRQLTHTHFNRHHKHHRHYPALSIQYPVSLTTARASASRIQHHSPVAANSPILTPTAITNITCITQHRASSIQYHSQQ